MYNRYIVILGRRRNGIGFTDLNVFLLVNEITQIIVPVTEYSEISNRFNVTEKRIWYNDNNENTASYRQSHSVYKPKIRFSATSYLSQYCEYSHIRIKTNSCVVAYSVYTRVFFANYYILIAPHR